MRGVEGFGGRGRLAIAAAATLVLGGCLDEAADPRPRAPVADAADAAPPAPERDAEVDPGCLRTFVYRHPTRTPPDSVFLAGSFASAPWDAPKPMADADGDGRWTLDLPVPPGEHQYKFIVDGSWIPDPDNPDTTDDGFGGRNSVFRHACPFRPDCLVDADCGDAARPFCRHYTCVGAEDACRCDDGETCDEAGYCVPAPPPPECDAERPCEAPLVCRDGRCEPECLEDADCGDGALCRDLTCVERQCEVDADCGDPLARVCDAGVCADNPCDLILFRYDPGGQQHETVHVAGSFNADAEGNWPATIEAGGWPMTWDAERGVWYVKRRLEDGTYRYKFVLDESVWIADPANPLTEPDGFGEQNSVLIVDCGAGPGACGDLEAFDWRDAVMYFAMVDRFHDSDGRVDPVPGATGGDAAHGPSGQYAGGDLPGVTAKIPYLRDLGVTALWLSAPYENRDAAGAAIDPRADPHHYSGYHGYWPSPADIDYADPDDPRPRPAVESRIGTEDDLRALVEAAHAAGIKVLFDYVMNHVDIDSGLYRAYPEWFARRDGRFALCGPENLWDDPYWGTRCAFTDYLPPFDFENPAARAWSVADAVWWAREFGIDGYRLDAIKHVPPVWLTDLRAALDEALPEPAGGRFYLVGETFTYDDRDLLKAYVDPATKLDGQFDFPLKKRLCEALFRPEGSLDALAGWMAGNDGFYGPGALMTTWIGNHDIPRAIHFASGEIANCTEGSHPGNGWTDRFRQPADAAAYERLGLAFAVLMTNPGIPLIYYGDEIGLAGGGDPDNRRLMPWDDGALRPAQRALRETVATLARIRAENPVLGRGRRLSLSADRDTWVYRLTGCGADAPDVTVALNRADAPRDVRVSAGAYVDLVTGAEVEGGATTLGPRSFLIWRAR